jgi:hypothetical protein
MIRSAHGATGRGGGNALNLQASAQTLLFLVYQLPLPKSCSWQQLACRGNQFGNHKDRLLTRSQDIVQLILIKIPSIYRWRRVIAERVLHLLYASNVRLCKQVDWQPRHLYALADPI